MEISSFRCWWWRGVNGGRPRILLSRRTRILRREGMLMIMWMLRRRRCASSSCRPKSVRLSMHGLKLLFERKVVSYGHHTYISSLQTSHRQHQQQSAIVFSISFRQKKLSGIAFFIYRVYLRGGLEYLDRMEHLHVIVAMTYRHRSETTKQR